MSTIATASKLPFELGLDRGCFDLVAVDEAGHATEPEEMAAFAGLLDPASGGQLLMAGDPKQLGPVHQYHPSTTLVLLLLVLLVH